MTRTLPPDEPIAVGHTFRLPQTLTGFARVRDAGDAKAREERWAIVVVARSSDISAWLLPRSASVPSVLPVPATAADGFTQDGWVWWNPKQVVFRTLREYEYGGPLDDASRIAVQQFYRDNRARERDERRARRTASRGRGRGSRS